MTHPTDLRLPLISGAFHYARVHPEQWLERLRLLRLMGLDTVETYVPWNLHEPRRGQLDFDGIADLDRFLDQTAEVGLRVIARPGPYICAEWENGGFPSWLTGIPGIRVRTADPVYLDALDRWFDVLIPKIAARQSTRGGNVCLVQVENEYGSFGSDQAYLTHLRDGLIDRGIDVPLVTSDGATDQMLTGGTLPDVWATANFGSDPDKWFEVLRKHRPNDPLLCMEFWNGWFDHWGEKHHVRDVDDAAQTLDRMLAMGASVNFYMAHGGTSFGCTAGANHGGNYLPTVTSYDYDAPIDESGRPTEKFHAYREVIGKYVDLPALPDLPAPSRLPATQVVLDGSQPLNDVIDNLPALAAVTSHVPTFEELGIAHGVVRHRARIPGPRRELPLTLPELADRAHVYAGGALLAVVERDAPFELPVPVPPEGLEIEVLVESMGRVNYGQLVGERKGLVGGVLHGGQHVHGWRSEALELPDLPQLSWATQEWTPGSTLPGFVHGSFDADASADAFLALDGWGKGYAWVNGFCLGRYWDRGPQHTLYIPAPVVQTGRNEVVLLELDHTGSAAPTIVSEADLGPV